MPRWSPTRILTPLPAFLLRAFLLPAVLLPALLLVGGCNGSELDDATRRSVAAAGDTAATALVRTLGGRLQEHMARGGPEQAIAFCSAEAQALTDSVSEALGPGWAVKRTTRRTRNPVNAPDSLEAEALAFFHDAAAGAETPDHYVQATPSGDYRYYEPLQVGPVCLQCHGPASELDPGVRRVLESRYPDDRATGYGAGDLRGVIRVTVPRTAIR